jgi:hypothetical protein
MVIDFAQRIIARIACRYKAFALKLQETESSFANGMPAIIVIQNSYFSFMHCNNKKIFSSDQHFGAPTA